MHRGVKLTGLVLLVLVLAGCGDSTRKTAELLIQDFNIVDPYEYDKIKVVVEEEKDPEELAQELLLKEMGLDIQSRNSYAEYGVSENNGVFVNAAILAGPELRVEPAFDKQAALRGQHEERKVSDSLIQTYEQLEQERLLALRKTVEEQRVDVTRDIQRRLEEQSDIIAKQREEQRMQEEIFGAPDFTVVQPGE